MSFQSLPLDVIEIAVGNLVEPYSPVFKKGIPTALSLLHCCHSWRTAYMSVAFRTLLFEFSRFHHPRFRFKDCPDFINPLDYMAGAPVREFKVDCGDWDYASYGDLSAWIEKSGYAALNFSQVRSLLIAYTINFMSSDSFSPDDITPAQCISQFIWRIKSMLPSLTSIELDRFTISSLNGNSDQAKLVADQVLQLIHGVKCLSFGLGGGFDYMDNINITGINGLSSFECSLHENSLWFICIIHHNARSLMRLKINNLPKNITHSLLYTFDRDRPIVFESLEALYLYPSNTIALSYFPKYLDVTRVLPDHFPELRKLVVDRFYPFKNNVVSCLSPKLEYIHICLPITPASLAMHQLSSKDRFPYLKHVTIHDLPSAGQREILPLKSRDEDFIKIVKSMCHLTKTLCKLELSYPVKKNILFDDLFALPIVDNLCFLNIDQTKLGFPDFVMLLQAAPFLHTLECSLDETLPKVAGIRPTELPGYIYSVLYPLNKSFVKLIVKWATPKAVKFHVRTYVLLAMTCPRFSDIELPVDNPVRTFNMIRKLLDTKSYQKHSHLVEPLLLRLRAKAIRMGYQME